METCVRGFSNTFMPENQVEVMDLQVVEGGELERAWKSSRRQRLARQEQRIWDEFVKEQDILQSVLKDDPYQFLEQLPEAYLKELMETELQRMKKEHADEEEKEPEEGAERPGAPAVTFALAGVDSDVFHIFSDDKDSAEEAEDEANESLESPHTVRELAAGGQGGGGGEGGGGGGEGGGGGGEERTPRGREAGDVTSAGKSTNRSSESVANLIESSIYCAKVKELRMKISDELVAIMISLESENVSNVEPVELRRMCKRSAEFCGRFQRIHLYQLQRQIHDLKRHGALALPFAKYTQFQSQMVRIVALHQNMLQAFQVFHKSFEQTACLRESGELLAALVQCARDAGAASARCAAPPQCAAARELYSDDLNATCDNMDLAVKVYKERVAGYLVAMETSRTSTTRSKRSVESKKGSTKKGVVNSKAAKMAARKASSLAMTSARLSMYSLDTLRLNVPAAARDTNPSGGTSKARVSCAGSRARVGACAEPQCTPKGNKKSPRVSRRPLMRAPREGVPRRRAPRDSDIQTMVEVVDVPSSQVSRDPSPETDKQSFKASPRHGDMTPSTRPLPGAGTPRGTPRPPVPGSPRGTPRPPVLGTPRGTPRPPVLGSPRGTPRPPVPGSPRALPKSASGHAAMTPRPARTRPAISRPVLSSIRSETRETELSLENGPMSPVSHIRCAVRERPDAEPRGHRQEEPKGPEQLADSAPSSGRKERTRKAEQSPAGYEVTRLLRQLCGGDAGGNRNERVTGAKNAQLLCVTGGSPRQPSTPQLLRILEETIQKKAPKPMYQKPRVRDADKLRLTFSIPAQTTDRLLQYRTKFVQHMLTSSLYANSAVGKPWEMIGSVSEEIIAELLARCAREMEIRTIVQELYDCETK